MVGWESEAFAVRSQIGHPEGLGMRDEQAEHASPRRARADPLLVVRGQSHGDEFGQTGALLVEDAESGIAGTRHGLGLLGDVAQQRRKLQIPLDEECRFEDPAKLGGIIDGAIRHTSGAYPRPAALQSEMQVTFQHTGEVR